MRIIVCLGLFFGAPDFWKLPRLRLAKPHRSLFTQPQVPYLCLSSAHISQLGSRFEPKLSASTYCFTSLGLLPSYREQVKVRTAIAAITIRREREIEKKLRLRV